MKKQIIRLTEEDLHNIVNNTVKRVIREMQEGSLDYHVNNILNPIEVEDTIVTFKDNRDVDDEIYVKGKDGVDYRIQFTVNGVMSNPGSSGDYFNPPESPETDETITLISVAYFNEEENSWVELPSDILHNESIKNFVEDNVEFNWDDYNDESDLDYDEFDR